MHFPLPRLARANGGSGALARRIGAAKRPSGKAIDVFAFGVLMNSVWLREAPYRGGEFASARALVVAVVTEGARPRVAGARHYPRKFLDLVRRCWATAPEKRPGMEEVLHALEEIQASRELRKFGRETRAWGVRNRESSFFEQANHRIEN